MRGLLTATNELAAQLARTARQGELASAAEHDGLRTMQSWLRGHGYLAPAEAARVVRTGRAPEQLPAVAAAFAAGTVTAGQVAEIARVVEPEYAAAAAAQDVDLAGVDAALAVVAAMQTPQKLARPCTATSPAWTPTGPSRIPPRGGG